jgi:phage shock protein A
MFKTIATIFLGRAGRAEEAIIDANAALMLEQKIREAEAGHDAAKRGLAALIARSKTERKALEGIETRIADLTERTRAALDAGKETLAADAAKLVADLENERAVRRRTLAGADEKADRMRLAIEKTQRQLIDLRQGLITARAIEAERKAVKSLKGDLSANAAIREGEEVLKRLLSSTDPIDEIEALEEIDAQLAGDDVVDRLTEAGFGKPEKLRAEDILERIKSDAGAQAQA